jgi:hypothetical protein
VTVFVQTDKPYYKPKHIVHARFYVVDAWLKPKQLFSGLNVYVDDPKGSRIVQKFDLSTENDCGGVSNFQFQLADEIVFGEWTIFAEVDGFVFNSTFVVDNYELPKYSLKIRPPSYFLALNECQNVQVVARYTFGKNVSGELIANMTIEGYGYYNEKGPTLEKEIHIMDGVGHFQVCVMDLLPVYRGEIPTYWTGKLQGIFLNLFRFLHTLTHCAWWRNCFCCQTRSTAKKFFCHSLFHHARNKNFSKSEQV